MTLQENAFVELKREYTPNVMKTVIAFANTNGGTVYIGIEDDGTVVGVDQANEIILKVTNAIRDSIKPDVTLFATCEVQPMERKEIICIEVQKGTASPYYLTGKGIRPEGVYVRQSASTVPASETAILNMIKDTDGEHYEEARSLNQDLAFTEAEKEFISRKVSFENNQQKTMKIINADGIYTNLGLLLSDQCVHTIKLAVFEGTDKAVFKDRREFTGSLLKQLNDAYESIDRYNRTRAEIDGLHRVDTRDYPTEAVREALLNALVHRDYSFSGSTLISIFDNRIEFVSIGGLIKGISYDDMMLGVSISRNANLANVFYRLELIEAYGTGVPKIFRSYGELNIKPKIETTDNAFKITLPNRNAPHENVIINGSDDRFSDEQQILALLDRQDTVSRKDVENMLGFSQATSGRILRKLVQDGKINTHGRGRNTRYSHPK